MNLTYLELIKVTEQSHTRGGQAGFIPAYVQQADTVLHMPQAEQEWWDAVRQANNFRASLES
jgi:hypothetical protein